MRRFVVLEHTWDGVHWDVMIESGGTLATWAVASPLVAGHEQPARRLADHRPVYLDYEGPISGDRGSVRRVDRGEFVGLAWTDEEVRGLLRGDQIRGELRIWRSFDGGSPGWRLALGKVD